MSKIDFGVSQKTLLIAILIALVLVTAAILKWLSPSSHSSSFHLLVGGLEVVLAIVLITYRSSWKTWTLLILILASWSGFSLSQFFFGLPCPCLGSIFPFPRVIPLILNGLMIVGAFYVLNQHPSCSLKHKKIIGSFVLFFVFGFIFSFIYYYADDFLIDNLIFLY